MGIEAKLIAATVDEAGCQISTVEVKMHRFVLAELNTHRLLSRNSASSRAVPTHKRITQVVDDPAVPIEFGANQAGMQAGDELDGDALAEARILWLMGRDHAVDVAEAMVKRGVHKQVVNRVLEPYMWHTVVITATYWGNFFAQRCSPLAQPEIRVAAEAIRDAIDGAVPLRAKAGEWHLPYIPDGYRENFFPADLAKISTARCARVSYETHDGTMSPDADMELYDRLVAADPMHASPLEHPAQAMFPAASREESDVYASNFHANWIQFRKLVEHENNITSRS